MVTATGLDWLCLAAADPTALVAYYREVLGLRTTDAPSIAGPPVAAALSVPPGALGIRPLTVLPSGGVHTHFAISVTPARYDELADRLGERTTVTERRFGGRRSLYHHDPAGHCVEFGERDGFDGPVGPLFEVVLEVADLSRALERYRAIGFEVVDRGHDRPRRRLAGPFDLELWEPHLGIADARGGTHVDLGVRVDDPTEAAARLAGDHGAPRRRDGRLFVRDPDGHTWWLASD